MERAASRLKILHMFLTFALFSLTLSDTAETGALFEISYAQLANFYQQSIFALGFFQP